MNPFPVNLETIATPKEKLLAFRLGELEKDKLEAALDQRFDFAPVVDNVDRLAGVIPVSAVAECFEAGAAIQPDNPHIFIYDMSDLSPLESFLDTISSYRAIVIRDTNGQHDNSWFGLVTISDLNRHYFRSFIYPILAGLEASLAELIDNYFPRSADWIRKCSEGQQVQHFGQWRVATENGVDTSPIISCTLSDLITIVTATSELHTAFGFSSKSQFKKRFGSISILRNQIMHPVRPLVLSVEDVKKLRERIAAALELTEVAERLTQNIDDIPTSQDRVAI